MSFIDYQKAGNTRSLLESIGEHNLFQKSFAIYGIGAVARKLLDNLRDIKIVGLMDKDPNNIGKNIYGFNILSYTEVIETVDVIIIAANEVYWDTIFQRISFLKYKHSIEIYFLSGEKAEQKADNNEEIYRNPYWENNIDTLKALIDEHQIISFDIFDTLIARKIARPEDLFSVVEQRANKKGILYIDFIGARKEAEEVCKNSNGEYFNIHDIYIQLKKMLNLPDGIVDRLKQLEIETELEYITPREDILECFFYSLKRKKTVYLITDIHLPVQVITVLLEKCRISGYRDLLISCDIKKSKSNSTMWQYFSSIINEKTSLHIGDNEMADIVNPRLYGITTFKVMSGYDLLLSSTIRDITINVHSVYDSKMLGLLINRLFNRPFVLGKSKGRPTIGYLFDFGYVFFGPLVLNYFIWLINETRKDHVDKILFLAREGYFLERIYNKMIGMLNIKNAPEGIYFKTSRRMASVSSLKTKEDIFKTLEDSFSGTLKELLLNRFGIDCEGPQCEEIVVNFDDKVKKTIEKYEKEILENSECERDAYLKYIDRLGLNDCKVIGLADTGVKGSIQYYMDKIIRTNLKGYYFTAFTGNSNPYGLGNDIKALYPENPLNAGNSSNMLKHHILFESTFIASEGMYIKIDSDGKFVNAPELNNQKLFHKKALIHEGIEAFIIDMIKLSDNLLESTLNERLVDQLYGLAMGSNINIEKHIKDVFFVDEMFGTVCEKKIWD